LTTPTKEMTLLGTSWFHWFLYHFIWIFKTSIQ